MSSEWGNSVLSDVISFNPKEELKKGRTAKKIAMEELHPFVKKISGFTIGEYSGGAKFRNGDTLLARITPCLENGKTAYVDILEQDETAFGSTEFIVMRAKPEKTDGMFTYYLASSPEFRAVAIQSMTGTTGRQRVKNSLLENAIFNIPPIDEQRAIGSLLTALDDKIEINNRINKSLEEMAQALFKRWFVDFEFPDENGQPYKSSGREMEESELGLIPKGWIASNVFDHVCERKQRNSDNKLLPVLSVVKEGKFVTSEEFFSKQVYSKDTSKYKVIRKNDVGYNPSRANIGSIAMLKEFDEGLLSPIYVIFSFDEMIMPYFFAYYMKRPGFIEKIAHHSSGTTRQNFNFEALKDFEIVIPPTIIQEKAFDSINEIEKHIESLLTQNEALIQLRDTLLPKLMSGEIRVPIEEVAADV